MVSSNIKDIKDEIAVQFATKHFKTVHCLLSKLHCSKHMVHTVGCAFTFWSGGSEVDATVGAHGVNCLQDHFGKKCLYIVVLCLVIFYE